MLSYRHSFHAGNFADVLKHIVQSLIIEHLKEKDKSFTYLDTHAGAGRYLLQSAHAQKNAEYETGIGILWQKRTELPELLNSYLSVIKHYNSTSLLQYYPGSPLIAKQLLRPQDKLLLTERHSSDYPLLKKEFQKDHRAQIKQQDGFLQLKAQLPPLSRRGFIFIDPSYEIKAGYQQVVEAVKHGISRFATGVYAIWYPVITRRHVTHLITRLQKTTIKAILQIELCIKPDNDQKGMTGSGMIIINPPWTLEAQMTQLLPWLHSQLVPEGIGKTTLAWVPPE